MKTLKKTLCLVLAVVLAVGVIVLPANAAKEDYDKFADKTSIKVQYEEAVATLTGMGIISGKSATSFAPTDALTRAEAMTLIVRALVASGEATLPATGTQFADVPASHYASKYVAYAVTEGIAAGKSTTSFAPNDTVTAYEMARWLLVATGARTQFDAANWQTQTGPAAEAAGFFTALTDITDYNKPLNREEAAQMLWNAINYTSEEVEITFKLVDAQGNVLQTVYTFTEAYALQKIVEEDAAKDPAEQKFAGCEVIMSRISTGSIGYEKYGLTKEEPINQDLWSRPDIKWTNGKDPSNVREYVVYSVISTTGLNEFYANHCITVADLLACMKIKKNANLKWTLYVDGKTTPAATGNFGDDTKLVLDDTMGARVMVYPDPAAADSYNVYVLYTYASYLKAEDVGAETVTLKNDYDTAGNYANSVTYAKGAMKATDVVTFNLSFKTGSAAAANVGSYAATEVGVIDGKNNDSRHPYFRINGKLVYASAKAIIVGLDGVVKKLAYNLTALVSSQKYMVWYDQAGNVLALVATSDYTPEAVENYGYVLEYSTKAGVRGVNNDDMSYGTEDIAPTLAQGKVLMVDLKTGSVNIYELDVVQDDSLGLGNERWYTTDLRGHAYQQITQTVNGAIGNTLGDGYTWSETDVTEGIVHGFVAYKFQPNGKISVVNMHDLKGLDYNVTYTVATEFFTADYSENVYGRIDIELMDGTQTVHYADTATEVTLLTVNSLTADRSRVAAYDAEKMVGYKALGNIVTRTNEGVPGKLSVHYGIFGLFLYNATTNIVSEAFVFGSHPVDVEFPYFIYTGREESMLGEGTVFNFIYMGQKVQLTCDGVNFSQMLLKLDNALDAAGKPYLVVLPDINASGKLVDIDVWSDYMPYNMVDLDNVAACVPGQYIADVTWSNYGMLPGMLPGDTMPLTSDCVIFDATTGAVVNTVHVGDHVTGYFADTSYSSFSLIVITSHDGHKA